MTRALNAMFAFGLACLCSISHADQFSVAGAWTRASVPGQKVAGVYLDITSAIDARLVAVDSAIARVAEFHLMSVKDGMMRMRAVDAIDLPAGKMVKLKPGGYHVMLFDLNRVLKAGDRIPVHLSLEGANGFRKRLEIDVEVRNIDGSRVQDPHD